jgi:hypothetical protein
VEVRIKKHTGLEEARRAIEATCYEEMSSGASLGMVYTWLHSPIRTQLFEIECLDIPTYVATHMVRHVTVQPYVSTRRSDRGAKEIADRNTPVDMILWANAEAILSMSGKRLCYKASLETRTLMQMIKLEMHTVDYDLFTHMQPQCVYQGGYCREPKMCGKYKCKPYDPWAIMGEINP